MKKPKTRILIVFSASVLLIFAFSDTLFSHCEIPCGIYDDQMRLDMMSEQIKTIEKSIKLIQNLSSQDRKNYNQIVRWIANKEKHADLLSDIATQYFMKQRIKPPEKSEGKAYDEYVRKLTLLHRIMVYSMKCKQTTDMENVEKLRAHLQEFRSVYLGDSSHKN
jgi:nickel superoxide dismutase